MDTLGLELVPWERDGEPQGLELKFLMLCFDQKSLSKQAIVFPTIIFLCFSFQETSSIIFFAKCFSGWSFWSPRIVFWVFFICLGFEFFVPSCHAASSDRVSIDNKPFDVSFMLTLCCCFWFLLLLEQALFCLAWAQLKFSGCALKRTWSVSPNLL